MKVWPLLVLFLALSDDPYHHPAVEALRSAAGFWVYSALIATMPKPEAFMGNVWYTWLYSFAQILGANFHLMQAQTAPKKTE